MSEQKDLVVQSEEVINLIGQDLVNTIGESFAFGHAFLWVSFKAGKKSYKTLAAYGALGNWDDIQEKLKWACPEITRTWINYD